MEKNKQRTDFTPPPSRSFYQFNNESQQQQNPLHFLPQSSPFLSTEWDPQTVLTNLSFLEQKIHQVKEVVHRIIRSDEGRNGNSPLLPAQQQMLSTDLTSIIIQLISTAGSLLPSIKTSILSNNPQFTSLIGSSSNPNPNPNPSSNSCPNSYRPSPNPDYEELVKWVETKRGENENETLNLNPTQTEDLDVKDAEDLGLDGDNLPIGSYELLQLEKEEILAPHTHFCAICGKGFKRDANLRMHMRGHGDEYKTHAALSKPVKEIGSEPIKRYSCPFVGCKRNKEHKNFQPLKTILCVKNHYKRSHCEKSYVCSVCKMKRFSVIADLKTHEKHCGKDKWICSCGTTFSRKDKLFGHVGLFQGHTPLLPLESVKGKSGNIEESRDQSENVASFGSDFLDGNEFLDLKGGYFSPVNFDSFEFDEAGSSFAFGKNSDG